MKKVKRSTKEAIRIMRWNILKSWVGECLFQFVLLRSKQAFAINKISISFLARIICYDNALRKVKLETNLARWSWNSEFLALFSSSEKRRLCYRRVCLSVCKPIFSRTMRHTEPIFSASLRLYFPWKLSKFGSFLTTKFGSSELHGKNHVL